MFRAIILSICMCVSFSICCTADPPDVVASPSEPITPGLGLSRQITFRVEEQYDDYCSFAAEIWPDGRFYITTLTGGPLCNVEADFDNILGSFLGGARRGGRTESLPATLPQSTPAPTTGFGSQGITSLTLTDGAQMNAWISANLLLTGLQPSSDGQVPTTGQYTLAGLNPQHVIAGDFNGDGHADLAVSNFGNLDTNLGGNITILLGNGAGTFTTGATVSAGLTPVAMYAADFNGDGKLDLAAANLTTNTISVMLGKGDGTFEAPVTYPVADTPQSIVAANFSGNGHLDIAVANQSGTISVLRGNGNGTFQPAVSYSGGKGGATYAAWQDLNGDGKPDLIVANSISSAFSILLGNG